ncbi:hypothetical protein H696_01345 [Fonticula alba]|uniref:Uncharacterized protein n=1 Tax=Fonticula alba TaxID=691883 RepID=A0A058ZDC2_FONAL|nr:hypothetical protein H696_01345 [Fonticula alba]KCV71936.1 hypothetical protein H696_01345 [Fonticula alba]|eukprot:XP_009493514.1 hypothetical protein H696_01345 [Fonticula alba]
MGSTPDAGGSPAPSALPSPAKKHMPAPAIELSPVDQDAGSLPPADREAPPTPTPPINKQTFSYMSRSFLAGGLAGCIAKSSVAPLDRAKILFQAGHPEYTRHRGTLLGVFRALRTIHQQEGLRGLFRGNSATLARIFPYAAIQFMSYEQIKAFFNKNQDFEQPYTRALAGAGAGMLSVLGTYPLDMVRSRLAFQVVNRTAGLPSQQATTLLGALRAAIDEGGARGLFRGFGPTMLGIVPYAGVSFFTYDSLKAAALRALAARENAHLPAGALAVDYRDLRMPPPVAMAVGFIAGGVAQTAAYPLDVVRRRMQVEAVRPLAVQNGTPLYAHAAPDAYKSIRRAFGHILRTEGWRGLYVGLSINFIKVAPVTGISFLAYEQLKQLFNI